MMLEMLGLTGTVKLIVDRTQWKLGKTWINILTVSVVASGVSVPLCWTVLNRKGNASGEQHREIVQRAIEKIGKHRIEYILADREFGNAELLGWLIGQELDFRIRLKKRSFGRREQF